MCGIRRHESRNRGFVLYNPDGTHHWIPTIRGSQGSLDDVPDSVVRLRFVPNLVSQGMVSQCVRKLPPSISAEAKPPKEERLAAPTGMIFIEQVFEDLRRLNLSLGGIR